MNYYLSVLPYLGAMKEGLAPMISITFNPDPSIFCDSPDQCLNDVQPWSDYFLYANSTKDSCGDGNGDALSSTDNVNNNNNNNNNSRGSGSSNLQFNTPIADSMDFNLTQGMESLLDALWAAHLHSINAALPRMMDKLKMLPAPEETFGTAWANIVDFIAATNFPCDMPTTDILQNL